jgi:hypothetical protein
VVVLYNILGEFGIPMKLARLIKMCLNEMYSKAHVSKHLSENSFLYLHSMDPYMAGRPVDIEIVKDNKTSLLNYIDKN